MKIKLTHITRNISSNEITYIFRGARMDVFLVQHESSDNPYTGTDVTRLENLMNLALNNRSRIWCIFNARCIKSITVVYDKSSSPSDIYDSPEFSK